MIRFILFIALFGTFFGRVEAREYERRSWSCSFSLEREDVLHSKTSLGSFETRHDITWSMPGELLVPKFDITPGLGVDPIAWASLEARIRTDIAQSGFFWNQNDLLFTGGFSLNYDGIYLLIQALGGKELEYTDDLEFTSKGLAYFGVTADGRYHIPMGNFSPTWGSSARAIRWTIQAHLPIDKKDGLSFHINGFCQPN